MARCGHVGFVAGCTCLRILVMSLKARHAARFPQPVYKGRLTTAEDAGTLEAFVSLFPLPGAFPQDICMGCSFTPFRSFLICEGGHPDHLAKNATSAGIHALALFSAALPFLQH